MKARTPTPLFEQAITPTPLPEGEGRSGAPGRPSPQPLSQGERGEPVSPRTPSPSGRRWPEGPDEGLPAIGALDWPAIERELDAYGC